MKSNHISHLVMIMMLFMISSCVERDPIAVTPLPVPDAMALQRAAMEDEFVSSELIPLSDDESSPMTVAGRSGALSPIKVFKIIKKTERLESVTGVEQVNDTALIVTVTRRTEGTLLLRASYNLDASQPDTVIRKPLAESFSRRVLFTLKERGDDDEEFKATGTVANLSKDCDSSSGSFNLVHNGTTTLILFARSTKWDDISCLSLNDGAVVEVEASHRVAGPGGAEGWLASEIEGEDDDEEDRSDKPDHKFRKAAISLQDGGTVQKGAIIREVTIFLTNSDSLTVRSPQEFFYYTGHPKHMMRVFDVSRPVRIKVTVESAQPGPEVVFLRRGNVAHGNVSFKGELGLAGERTEGGVTVRTYEAVLPAHGWRGYFHSAIEAWTHASIYDDAAAVSTHSWSLPYIVR